jgi:mannose-1-phosphate guanylyltransferase
MVPILNRPFLEHMIEWLRAHEVRDIIVTTCYLPEAIKEYFKSGEQHGVRMEYVVEEQPLDTGGAIKNAEPLLGERFFVFNGDILTELDLRDMAEQHERAGAQVSISLTWVEDPTPYGVIETDQSGRIVSFREKPKPDQVTSHYINAGTYLFEPEVLAQMPEGSRFSIEKEFYPQALARGVRMHGYRDGSYWLDIGTAQKYLQAHQDILSGRLARRGAGAEIAPGIWSGEGSKIASDARLAPPVTLGARTVIGARAEVGPFAVLGDDVRVGDGARIAHSVVWGGSAVGDGAILERCVIGRGVTVAAGAQLDGRAMSEESHAAVQAA